MVDYHFFNYFVLTSPCEMQSVLIFFLVWRHLYMHSSVQTRSLCASASRTHWCVYIRIIDLLTTDISIKSWIISVTYVSTIRDCMPQCKTNEQLSADNRYIWMSLSFRWNYVYALLFQINTKAINRCSTSHYMVTQTDMKKPCVSYQINNELNIVWRMLTTWKDRI